MVIEILLEQTISVKWSIFNRTWYEDRGIVFTKYNAPFVVHIDDLARGSHCEVDISCDFCGSVFKRRYRDYLKVKNKSQSPNDSCNICSDKKRKENNLRAYGVKNATQSDKAREKRKRTSLQKYGVEHYISSKQCKEKTKETCIKLFGVENPFQSNDIKEKIRETNIEKYGYSHAMKDPSRKKEIMSKRSKTLYEKGISPCSRQQRYIASVIGGELNYPIDNLMLDIAFPEDKIYVEYQGSGHDLDVKMGKLTQEQFDRKELSRFYFLRNREWKQVEIISRNDLIPSDEKILQMVDCAKKFLLYGNTFVSFDIDRGTVRNSSGTKEYYYGELRKIKKSA